MDNTNNACHANQATASNPVYYRSFVRETKPKRTTRMLVQFDCSAEEVDKRVHQAIEKTLHKLLKYREQLSKIDNRLERVIRPLEDYSNGITFKKMRDEGFQVQESERRIAFNQEVVNHLAERVPKELDFEELPIALLMFILHEIIHVSQGMKHFDDVQCMKKVGKDGLARLGELDLRSDFLAAKTLALVEVWHSKRGYNPSEYVSAFFKIWCRTGQKILRLFPAKDREHKQRRVFGYLLMSNQARKAFCRGASTLNFDAEMWPVWSESSDWLSIYSNGEPVIPGCSVDPEIMKQILMEIKEEKYNDAMGSVDKLVKPIFLL